MTVGGGAWRAHTRWWVPALAFLVANLVLLSAYRLVLAGQSQLRTSRVERSQEELERLDAQRQLLIESREQLLASRESIDLFYSERLSREDVRLTRILAEVRDLAARSGLEPSTVKHGTEEIDGYGLLRRSIEFNVEGSYLEFRRFVNLLELSDSFLVLEQVGLRGEDETGSMLRIALGVSTFFTKPEEVGDGTPGGGTT